MSEDLETILTAAYAGRVERLQVARDTVVWGPVPSTFASPSPPSSRSSVRENLLEVAARQTLLHGGDVRVVDREGLPCRVTAVACLRR
jgi:hypothetical protein